MAIPYTPTAEELNHPESAVIWYLDGSGQLISVPNGHYNADMGSAYYTDYLPAAKRLGVTDGPGGNRFWPEQAVSR